MMHTPAHKAAGAGQVRPLPRTLAETFDSADLYPPTPAALFERIRSLESQLALVTSERDALRYRLSGLEK